MRSALRKTQAVVALEALSRSAIASGAIAGAGFQNTLYVNPGGNDETGDGTFFRQFQTIARANEELRGVAAEGSAWLVFLGIGTYNEDVAVLPWVSYASGGTQDDFNVIINGNVTLDTSWSTTSGSFPIVGIEALQILGTTTFDYAGVGAPQGQCCFFNVDFEDTVTLIGNSADFSQGGVFLFASVDDAVQTNLTGVFCESYGSNFSGLSIISTATAPARLFSWGDLIGFPPPILSEAAFVVDASAGTDAIFSAVGSAVTIGVTLKGTGASYTSTIEGIGRSVTLLDDAPSPAIVGSGSAPEGAVLVADGSGNWVFNSLGGVAFSATTPGNWAGAAPTDLAAAVNRISAAVAALRGSPIP
jgi:hypothetical protein